MHKISPNHIFAKSVLALLLALAMPLALTSCAENPQRLPVVEDYDEIVANPEKKHIKLGVVPGPYKDIFKEAIQPVLAQKGYTVEIVLYKDYTKPNLALANYEIDLNMFQNYRYLNKFKLEHDLDLAAITEIPTASMVIFSYKYNSLDDIENKAKVLLPKDPTNFSRALLVLEQAGIIKLSPAIDKTKATEKDVTQNPKNLRFYQLEAQELAQSIIKYDLSVINGNFALANGLNLSKSLYSEVLDENYMNIIVVRTEDLGALFVQDIIDAVSSEFFKGVIKNADEKYGSFQLPRNFSSNKMPGAKSKDGNN